MKNISIPFKTKIKKYLKTLVCLAIIVLTLIGCAGCSGTGTYSFERGNSKKVTGWKTYNYQAENNNKLSITKISIVSDGYKGKALKIASTENNDARVYKQISVKEKSVYEISVMVKTENVEGGHGANISGYNCYTGHSEPVMGTTEGWVKQTIYVKTDEGQKKINLSLGLGGYSNESKGTAYFDELSVKKVSAVPEGATAIRLVERTDTEKKDTEVSIWLKLLFVIAIVGVFVYCLGLTVANDKYNAKMKKSLTDVPGKPDKRDAIIMAAMTVLCAVFSFVHLGSVRGCPENYWKAGAAEEYVTVHFKEKTTVSRVAYYSGIPSSTGKYSIQYLTPDGKYLEATALNAGEDNEYTDFFKWDYKNVEFTTDAVRVYVDTPGFWLNELGFYSKNSKGEYVKVELDIGSIETSYKETKTSGKAENLFDEQKDVCAQRTFMNSTYFDEIYHPRTAYEHLHGLSIYEWTHPPLGKTIISIGIAIFGMNTLGWRFMGTLFGVLLVPLMYAFAKKVFKKSEWAFFVSFLMMFDFMRLSQTRLATIDTYACFFTLAMMFFMYDYFVQKSYDIPEKKAMLSLALSGLMFGLGAASKWTCLYTGAGLAIIFFIAKIAEFIDCYKKRGPSKLTAEKYFTNNFIFTCGMCILFFVMIPVGIYVLSYIPYMASKPGQDLLDIVIANQKDMYNYHSDLTSSHTYGAEWYTWPFSTYNIFYFNGDAGESVARVMTMGNPLVWWLGIPCFIASLYFAWRNRDKRMGFFAVAYIMQFAPWFMVNRVCYIYHYFTCVPFTMFMIAYVFKELVDKKIIPKWSVWLYMILVLIVFIMFYPALMGLSTTAGKIDSLKWLSTWSF